MYRLSLAKKALIAFLIVLLPIVITFFYIYVKDKAYLEDKFLDEMTVIAEAYEGQVYQFLSAVKRQAREFADDRLIRERLADSLRGDKQAIPVLNEHLIHKKRPMHEVMQDIYVLSIEGRVMASTNSAMIGKDLSHEEFFQKGREGLAVTENYSGWSGAGGLVGVAPIFNLDETKAIGVIANFLSFSDLNKLMTGEFSRELGAISWSKGRHKTMETYLVNRDKLMITESLFIKDAVLNQVVNTLPVNACLSSSTEVSSFYNNYRKVRVAGASMCLPAIKWTLLVEVDDAEVFEPLNTLLRNALMGIAVVSSLMILLLILFLRNVVRPLKRLSVAARDIAAGDYEVMMPVKTSDEVGKLVGSFNTMAHDIRERTEAQRHAEEAVRKSEEKYRTLFEESKDGVFMSSPQGEIIDINPALVNLLGYASKEEMLRLNLGKDIYYDGRERERFKQEMEKHGFVKDFAVALKRKDGEMIHVTLSATIVHDSAGNITSYRGIIHDMTEYKRLEEQFLQAQKMEAIGQLAAGIAHDFNNILTSIIGNATVLQMKTGGDPVLTPFLHQIISASERAASLTQGLLSYSRKQVLYRRLVSLHDLLWRLERILLRIIGEDIELRIGMTDQGIMVMADPGQIEQVLINLATNARDVMPHGGIFSITAALTRLDEEAVRVRGLSKPGAYAVIAVTDTGMGMDEAVQEKIFEPFFTTKEVGKGTGLGLAVAYGIIKQHEGYIDVESKPGQGTTFHIFLPAMRREAPSATVTNSEGVLVAEDDADVRGTIKWLLEESGFRVTEAVDGEDAVRRFHEYRDQIRLLILDVIMPKKDGREVYEEIKRLKPDVRVIFISGYPEDVVRRKGLENDEFAFLAKPVTPDDLIQKVREALDRP